MSTSPSAPLRVTEQDGSSLYLSDAMWKKIDAGQVKEQDVSRTMTLALDIFWPDTANHYIHRAVLDSGSIHGARELGLEKAIGALRHIIERSPETFDGNAGRPMHAGGETILEKAFSFRHEKVFWRGLSFVPLFEMLEQHGTVFHEYMFTRTDRANKHYVSKPPASILSYALEPDEMAYLLEHIPAVSPGALRHQLITARTNSKRSPHVADTIQVALEHGLSLYETDASHHASPIDLIAEIVRTNTQDRQGRNTEPETFQSLELAKLLETKLTVREIAAKQAYADFIKNPTPDKLDAPTMRLLANIDALDTALCKVRCDQSQASTLLDTVNTLDPFLRERIPIALTRLERIAGKDIVSGAQHDGKLGIAKSHALGGESQ